MTRPATRPRREPSVSTPSQMRARVGLLTGAASLVARAATTDESPAAPGSTGELWLYGVVGGWWRGFDAESVANALRGLDVDTLFVRVHSPGGLASDGVAISNLLRNHRAHIVVVVDGLAASAASVIAIAGDEIVMCPGSQLMVHDASTFAYGNAADIRATADWIDSQSDNYAGVYAYKAGGTAAQWREVMTANDGRGTWYTAEGAVTAGLADEVGTRVAAGSPPVAPDDDAPDDEDTWARAAHDLQILEQCVPAAARATWAGQTADPTPKPPSASAVGSITIPNGTESAVAFSDEQMKTMRAKLELSETADEAAILAAINTVVDESLEERPTTAQTSGSEIPDGHVVIPAAKLADLEAGAAQARTTAATLHDKERSAFLDSVRDKYLPTSRAGWEAEYNRDEAGVRAHFASASVLVPTSELGHAEDNDAEAGDTLTKVTESTAYKNWSM